ncbi:MAG TPA: aldo/keto reductase [Rhizomicrobium sp.]|nr:aldo/keto reductase [Rhizomicrobium sp.]
MQKRKLGTSGLDVSVVGLGCNNFGMIPRDAAARVIDRAIDKGITLFDTADIYGNRGGSETTLGELLGPRRKQIVLATKFGMKMDDDGTKSGASRRYVKDAVDASLKRLKTDWIDLYQLHTPDPKTPIEETLRALDELVTSGKVRFIGCSNMPAWQIVDSLWIAQTQSLSKWVTAQDEYSLLVRGAEHDLIPALKAKQMSLLPYFPLASGLLTGKYKAGQEAPSGTRFSAMKYLANRYMTEKNFEIVERLKAFCAKQNRTLLELAFSYLLSEKTVASVIAGATKPEQIDLNAMAANWQLTPEEIAEVKTITEK